MSNKILKTLEPVRKFTQLGAAKPTSKESSDPTKIAIKNENVTPFGRFLSHHDAFLTRKSAEESRNNYNSRRYSLFGSIITKNNDTNI